VDGADVNAKNNDGTTPIQERKDGKVVDRMEQVSDEQYRK
jgi:hypothetical protein